MRLLVISLILLFIPLSNIYGEEFTWPDANDYTYPEYEINIIKHLNNGIQLSVLENKTFKFIINYKLDLSKTYDKPISIMILNLLTLALEKNVNTVYCTKTPIYKSFITKYENSDYYDEKTTNNKLKAWILIRAGKFDLENMTDDEFDTMESRRKKILENISINNKNYAPLAQYLLNVVDCDLTFHLTPTDKIQQKINKLNEFIKNYSNSKFALLAKLYLVRQYFYIKDYEKAINLCIEIVKTNDNYFIGPGDLYSTVYLELIPLYNKIDKAKTNPLFQKINRNYYNYDEIEKSYR